MCIFIKLNEFKILSMIVCMALKRVLYFEYLKNQMALTKCRYFQNMQKLILALFDFRW